MTSTRTYPHGRLYRHQEYVEDVESYRAGGYHPVKLNETYCQNRYRMAHKLGYGSYSTVWLASDSVADKYVSIKFLTANVSKSSKEAQMLARVAQRDCHDSDNNFVSPLLDDFTIDGPNGQHRCLVSGVLGPTLSDMKLTSICDLLPLDIAKRATTQLASGLAYIHACDMIHGDIHLKNLAWRSLDFGSWSLPQVYQSLGSPIKQVLSRIDDQPLGPEAPPYVVLPAHLLGLYTSYKASLSILDFGEASLISESRTRWHTALPLQAPEALLGEPVGQPADIWAFACTVFELFDNKSLFRCSMPSADDILFEVVDSLGRLPDHWWTKWKYRGECYEDDGTKKVENLTEEYLERRPLAMRVNQMRSSPPAARSAEQLSDDDLAGLQQLLARCLRYKPEERVTAQEILNLDWIKKLRTSPSVGRQAELL
ncbi:MAG: hypothetical protein Q9196_004555 [Gyalolechia fulgens]